MELTNEMMFYGGMILAAVSAVGIVLYALIARMRKMRLDMQFDQEYGEIKKDHS